MKGSRVAAPLGSSVEPAFADLVEELTARFQSGESVDVEACLRDHPEYAEQLRPLLPALKMLAELSQSGPRALAGILPPDGSLAGDTGTLGDFRILREVGRGGMGIVYEAEQLSLGRRVALKVLPFAGMMDERHQQRFKNEARAAASLEHPHIVPIYGVGCERGVHYYAMRFIEGRTLAGLIARQRPDPVAPQGTPVRARPAPPAPKQDAAETASPAAALTERAPLDTAYFRRVAEWGIQAAEALEHAHNLGVVHRDIKPSNLLLDGQGKLWITDFGLAQFQKDAGLTTTGDVLGTLRYMSPEQALGKRGLVDHRTDVYSLGVTLYELLTLHTPFTGEDRQELLRQVTSEEPPAPRRRNAGIPVELETIVLKATAREPAERYATAQELADDLRRFLEHRPIHARRPTLLQRVHKWAGRHQFAVMTGLAVLLLVVLTLGVSVALIAHSEAEAVAQGERADLQRRLAEEHAVKLRRHLYATDLSAAHRAWRAGNRSEARGLLARYLPGEGLEDLRGFEWYFLWAHCPVAESRKLEGHEGRVYSVAFSPDGRTLASAGKDCTVRLWDFATGKPLAVLGKHLFEAYAVTFSPDGKWLASQGADATVRLWDVAARKPGRTLARGDGKVVGIVFLPGGRKRAFVLRKGSVALWDPDTDRVQELALDLAGAKLRTGAPARDGKTFAVGDTNGRVTIWDTETGQLVSGVQLPKEALSIAFAPDGRFVTGSRDSALRLWRVGAKSEDFLYQPHETPQTAVAVSANGRLLAAAGTDRAVRVWDAVSLVQRDCLLAGPGETWCAAFSADGQRLATCGDGGSLLLHRLVETPPAERIRLLLPDPRRVRLAPVGRSVVTVHFEHGRDGVLLSDPNGECRWTSTMALRDDWLHSYSFAGNGRWWAHAGPAGIKVIDVPSGHYPGAALPGVCHAFTADGKHIATANKEGVLQRWKSERNGLGIFTCREPDICRLAYSPDGNTLASGHTDGRVLLWDVASGQRWAEAPPPHQHRIEHLCFSPDGATLASASGVDEIRRWDVRQRRPMAALTRQFTSISDMAFSPDGRTLVAADESRVYLFHLLTGRELFALEKHHTCPPCVNFTPDGQALITGTAPVYGEAGHCYDLITWHAPRPGAGVAQPPLSPARGR